MKEINIARTIINKRKEKGLTQDELMAPLALTIVLPSIIVFVTVLVPESTSDFQRLLAMLPDTAGEYNQKQMILGLVLNKIMPAFFLLIPVIVCYGSKFFCGGKGKTYAGNSALFSTFLKAVVSIPNTCRIFRRNAGFLHLVCCND